MKNILLPYSTVDAWEPRSVLNHPYVSVTLVESPDTLGNPRFVFTYKVASEPAYKALTAPYNAPDDVVPPDVKEIIGWVYQMCDQRKVLPPPREIKKHDRGVWWTLNFLAFWLEGLLTGYASHDFLMPSIKSQFGSSNKINRLRFQGHSRQLKVFGDDKIFPLDLPVERVASFFGPPEGEEHHLRPLPNVDAFGYLLMNHDESMTLKHPVPTCFHESSGYYKTQLVRLDWTAGANEFFLANKIEKILSYTNTQITPPAVPSNFCKRVGSNFVPTPVVSEGGLPWSRQPKFDHMSLGELQKVFMRLGQTDATPVDVRLILNNCVNRAQWSVSPWVESPRAIRFRFFCYVPEVTPATNSVGKGHFSSIDGTTGILEFEKPSPNSPYAGPITGTMGSDGSQVELYFGTDNWWIDRYPFLENYFIRSNGRYRIGFQFTDDGGTCLALLATGNDMIFWQSQTMVYCKCESAFWVYAITPYTRHVHRWVDSTWVVPFYEDQIAAMTYKVPGFYEVKWDYNNVKLRSQDITRAYCGFPTWYAVDNENVHFEPHERLGATFSNLHVTGDKTYCQEDDLGMSGLMPGFSVKVDLGARFMQPRPDPNYRFHSPTSEIRLDAPCERVYSGGLHPNAPREMPGSRVVKFTCPIAQTTREVTERPYYDHTGVNFQGKTLAFFPANRPSGYLTVECQRDHVFTTTFKTYSASDNHAQFISDIKPSDETIIYSFSGSTWRRLNDGLVPPQW